MKAYDFFCGAGGLTRGLLDAGIEVVTGIDSDGCCQSVYEYNNPGVKFLHTDVSEITPKSLELKERSGGYDDVIFAGCAPCQPFSSQRKGDRKTAGRYLTGSVRTAR